MLPKRYRLPRSQFPVVLKKGFRNNRSFFTVIYALAPKDLTNSRFGIIVSTKVSKSAANRNLIKRRLRHAVMSAIPDLKTPIDAIIIVKPSSLNQSAQSLATELSRLLFLIK